MDLSKVKSVKDAGKSFVVTHADHGEFPVAKAGLPPEMVEKIQKMCNGGYAADSDVVPPVSSDVQAPPDPYTSDDTIPRTVKEYNDTARWIAGPHAPAATDAPPPTDWSLGHYLDSLGNSKGPAAPWPGIAGTQPMLSGHTPQPGPQGVPAPAAPAAPATATDAPQVAQMPPPTGISLASASGQMSPKDQVAPGFQHEPADTKALDEATQQQKRGLDAQYGAAQDAEKERQDAYGNQQQTIQDYKDEYVKRVAASNAEFDNIKKQIAAGKLDPEKFWQQPGKNKALAIFGAALGTAGAILGKGHNDALDMINQHIDRYTDAQKTNLANLKDQLNINQSQFNRMNAEIDKKALFDKDMAGLTLQQIASKQAGSVAYGTGMQLGGALLAQNVMNKQNLIASHLQTEAMPVLTRMQLRSQQADINSKNQTLQFQQMNANMQAAQMGMPIPFPNASNGRTLTQWLSGQGSASTGIYTPHEAMLARMPNTDDEQGVRVPVVLPNGQTAAVPRFLKHKEDREKFNDAQNHVQAFQQAIDNYGEDAKDPSYIGQIAGGNQTLKTSADQLMKAYNELTTGSTRYTETDAKAAGHSIGYTDGGRGLLDLMFSNPQKAIPVLNKIAEEAGIRTADTYLMGGRKAAIPGHKYNQQEIDSMPEGFFARGK